jgi:uncharacterized membrane protein
MSLIQRLHFDARLRFLVAFLVGMACFSLLARFYPAETTWVLAWDGFSIALLALSASTFTMIGPKEIKLAANTQDTSRFIIFLVVLSGSLFSLLAIVLLFKDHKEMHDPHLPASILAVTTSWMLIHTTFCFRYAHIYYSKHSSIKDATVEGIDFPGKYEPDYWDFAYFAFTIGMTAQVSDTAVTLRRIRRIVLAQSVISFAYNTVIIALTISVLSSIFQ